MYEGILKVVVGLIVICFVAVVAQYLLSGALDFGEVMAGFVPSFSSLTTPAPAFQEILSGIAASDPDAAAYWSENIVAEQQGWLMSAFATAVGINMTFLLPYSMLSRGWGKVHRGLATCDLGIGLFIPFVLATSCVVIAAMVQFHGEAQPGLMGLVNPEEVAGLKDEEISAKAAVLVKEAKARADEVAGVRPTEGQIEEYLGALMARSKVLEEKGKTWSEADERIAAMLVSRDAPALSQALSELLGSTGAKWVFGLGVLSMALSTITILMLISGFVVCEVLDVPTTGWPMRLGCMAAATGVIGPFLGDSFFWLAKPTSIFGLVLLPIAYLTFLLMINSKMLMGNERPAGGKRLIVNLLLCISTLVAFVGSGWALKSELGWGGLLAIVVAFLVLLGIGAAARGRNGKEPQMDAG